MGNVQQRSYFDGLVVEHSYWRAYTIHGTMNATLSRSIAYDTMGSAVYLEDGSEEWNVIKYNLVALVHVLKPHAEPWKDYDPAGTYDSVDWIKPEGCVGNTCQPVSR